MGKGGKNGSNGVLDRHVPTAIFKNGQPMRQVLGPGALGGPGGIVWRGRWEGGSGWGIHVTPWLIHVNV